MFGRQPNPLTHSKLNITSMAVCNDLHTRLRLFQGVQDTLLNFLPCGNKIGNSRQLHRSQRHIQRDGGRFTIQHTERNITNSCLESTIQRKLTLSKACIPLLLISGTIAAQNLLNRTVEPLSKTIRLRVVSCRQSNSTAK